MSRGSTFAIVQRHTVKTYSEFYKKQKVGGICVTQAPHHKKTTGERSTLHAARQGRSSMNKSSNLRRGPPSQNRRRRRRSDAGATGKGQRDNDPTSDDIVEQLRRQRQKQHTATQERQSHSDLHRTPKERLGKFQYCEQCRSYFPQGAHVHALESDVSAQPPTNNGSTPPRFRFLPSHSIFPHHPDASRPCNPSPFLDYPFVNASFLGYNSRSRQELVERWRFQLWSKSSGIVSSCVTSRNEEEERWHADDSVPSNRSFDVLPGKDLEQFPTFVSCRPEPRCRLANHFAIRDVERQDQRAIHTVKRLRHPRLSGEEYLRFGMIVSYELSSETAVKWYQLSSSSTSDDELPQTRRAGEFWNAGNRHKARWNDFCSSLDGQQMILVGESKSRGGGLGPWVASYVPERDQYTHAQLRSGLQAISPSNMLCVEPFDDHAYCFGHASGNITLWDDRTGGDGTVALATNMRNAIRLLPQESWHVLVRGGGALCDSNEVKDVPLCQLWDVRNLSNAILDFALPAWQQNRPDKAATFRSNGMATDPERTVLFSPWVEQSDGYQCPRLGVWGLHSGEYLGSRRLDETIPSLKPSHHRLPSQVVAEISDCVTPGWEESASATDSRSTSCVSRRCGAAGVWYRVHERRGDKTKSSSIRQLTFEGKCDS